MYMYINRYFVVHVCTVCVFSAMAASTVDEHVFLFWYNESDWSVYYYNTTGNGTMGVYLQLEPNTVLVSMTAHDNSNKIPLYG